MKAQVCNKLKAQVCNKCQSVPVLTAAGAARATLQNPGLVPTGQIYPPLRIPGQIVSFAGLGVTWLALHPPYPSKPLVSPTVSILS